MLETTTLASGEVSPYCFGPDPPSLSRRRGDPSQRRGAGGGSQMITVPAHGLDISIMTNGSAANPAAVAFKLIDLLLADQLPLTAQEAVPRVAADAFPGLQGRHYHDLASGLLMRFGTVAGLLGVSVHGSHVLPLRKGIGHRVWIGVMETATSSVEIDLSGVDPAQAPETLERGPRRRRTDRGRRRGTELHRAGPPWSAALSRSSRVGRGDAARPHRTSAGRIGQQQCAQPRSRGRTGQSRRRPADGEHPHPPPALRARGPVSRPNGTTAGRQAPGPPDTWTFGVPEMKFFTAFLATETNTFAVAPTGWGSFQEYGIFRATPARATPRASG
ncbi:hypothetical protein Ddc_20450 [Ditylenchus destructor]|nr:hypothetical protein Ddc_20450 [Ditylenchus destructor]